MRSIVRFMHELAFLVSEPTKEQPLGQRTEVRVQSVAKCARFDLSRSARMRCGWILLWLAPMVLGGCVKAYNTPELFNVVVATHYSAEAIPRGVFVDDDAVASALAILKCWKLEEKMTLKPQSSPT